LFLLLLVFLGLARLFLALEFFGLCALFLLLELFLFFLRLALLGLELLLLLQLLRLFLLFEALFLLLDFFPLELQLFLLLGLLEFFFLLLALLFPQISAGVGFGGSTTFGAGGGSFTTCGGGGGGNGSFFTSGTGFGGGGGSGTGSFCGAGVRSCQISTSTGRFTFFCQLMPKIRKPKNSRCTVKARTPEATRPGSFTVCMSAGARFRQQAHFLDLVLLQQIHYLDHGFVFHILVGGDHHRLVWFLGLLGLDHLDQFVPADRTLGT
jgi:hypothetical protein